MPFWIKLIFILLLQETISTTWVTTVAYQRNHSNLFILCFILLLTTLLEIYFFYNLGAFIKKNKKCQIIIKKLKMKLQENKSKIISNTINRILSIYKKTGNLVTIRDKKIFLFSISMTLSPALADAFISPWLNLSLREVFIPILSGISIWYACIIITVVAVNQFINNPEHAKFIIVMISIIYVALRKIPANKWKKENIN
jgi:hypothetical protein